MKINFLSGFFFSLFFISSAFADNLAKTGPAEKTFSASIGTQTVLVKVKFKPFDWEKHDKASGLYDTKEKLIGTDYGTPSREFEYFRVVFLDGKEITIDKKWYADLYNPNFADGFFTVALGDDLKSIFVFMNGSSGAGHYDVMWVLRQDGYHSRFVTDVSDMSPFDPDIGNVIKETGRHLVK